MSNSWIRRHAAPLTLVGALLSSPGAQAQVTNHWTGSITGEGSTWDNANHWSPQAPSGGPAATSVAVFSTQGTATNIIINLKQATDQTQQVGRIDLRDGPDRTISNGNNASGRLQINGVEGRLLVNTSTSSTLTFAESSRRAMDLYLATAGAIEVSHTGARIAIWSRLTGIHGFHKTGHGTLELTASNTITGAVTVSGGTVVLASSTGGALQQVNSIAVGAAAPGGAAPVAGSAALLISTSNQVNDGATVTLSGGTITRGSGVSEVFGNLNVTAASFVDFGTGTTGTLSFGTYTASALLTLQNFLPGNKLQFATGFDANLLPTGGNLSNANFSFSNGFSTGTEGGYFTITAIPEPSTYAAAIGLLSLMLWPSRRRIIRDTKKILGLTPPMRDRLAAKRAHKA
jgi:autotransporter-associated beta strand protein